ncbi:ABC transporter ATP-binding protein [Hungatella hathewayi]|uniref:ABC transporter ATP-binding protein n=1 Tax=Hungatella hathewayi TaxID=154046 RepID=UPI0035684716
MSTIRRGGNKGFLKQWGNCFVNLFVIYKKIWRGNKLYMFNNFFMMILRALHPFNSIIFLSRIIQELTGNRVWKAAILDVILYCLIEFVLRVIEVFYNNYERYKIENIKTQFLYEIEEKAITLPYQTMESAKNIDCLKKAMEIFFPTQAQFMDIRNSIICGSRLVSNSFQLVGVITILFTLNYNVVLSIIIVCFLSTILNSVAANKEFELWDQSLVKIGRKLGYYQYISTDFTFAKEMRINQLGQWVVDKMKKITQEMMGGIEKITRVFTLMSSISNIIQIILNGAIYIYLGSLVLVGATDIAGVNMYINSVATMITALLGISSCLITIKKSGLYIQTYLDYIDMGKASNEFQTQVREKQDNIIELQDVWFRYPDQKEFILKGINLVIRKNSKVAIVGDNGAGKTTLINLIMRMYEPTRGRILLNQVDISTIPINDYMKCIASVDQDFRILECSMIDNIRFDSKVSEQHVNEILKAVGLDSVVAMLPKGTNTVIGKLFEQSGVELSAGQQQKVAIARALCKDSEVVILDEPTAMLSPRMEHEIYMNFARLTENRTAIYISHRMSSCQFCDDIVVLDKGKIVEYGSHSSLIKKKGEYYKMYTLQAEFYQD